MNSQASEYVSMALKAASMSSRSRVSVSDVQKRQRSVGTFPTWSEITDTGLHIQKVLAQALATTPVFPPADWLQVHAVDEVIGLLRGEGSGFLQLVPNESETTADHEQQQGGDDEAESQREDCTWRRKDGKLWRTWHIKNRSRDTCKGMILTWLWS